MTVIKKKDCEERDCISPLQHLCPTTTKRFSWSPSSHHLKPHTFLSAPLLHFIMFSDESSPPVNYCTVFFPLLPTDCFPAHPQPLSTQRQQSAFHEEGWESSASSQQLLPQCWDWWQSQWVPLPVLTQHASVCGYTHTSLFTACFQADVEAVGRRWMLFASEVY